MIEAIQVTRDVVIILSFVIITATVVIVGRAILHLLRKAETVRASAAAVVDGVVNPLRTIQQRLTRVAGLSREARTSRAKR